MSQKIFFSIWLKTRKFKFVMSLVEEVIALKTLVGTTTNSLSILSEMEILKSFMTVERINFDENKMPLTFNYNETQLTNNQYEIKH